MMPNWREPNLRDFVATCLLMGMLGLISPFSTTAHGRQDSGSSQPSQSSSNQQTEAPAPPAKEKKEKKGNEAPQTKLRIEVTSVETGKPIANASIYIRFEAGHTFLFHKSKQAEMNFKTSQEGVVKIPDVPQTRVLIQVVAPGWHTYGKWYDFDKDEETVQIKLERPPKWY